MKLVKDWGIASLWINRQYRPLLIHPATRFLISNDTGVESDAAIFNSLSTLVMASSFAVDNSMFLMKSQTSLLGTQLLGANGARGQNVSLNFARINPTKFVVTVAADGPFFLVLGETFDQRWHVFRGDPGALLAPFSTPIPESAHLMANGFANAWYMDTEGKYTITIYYVTQSVVDFGAIVSVVSLFTTFGCILLNWTWKRFRTPSKPPVATLQT
jgi:hypothetical protein